MKKVGNFFCSENYLDVSRDEALRLLGENEVLLKEFKKGSLDTAISIKDDVETGVLVGFSSPLRSKVSLFIKEVISCLSKCYGDSSSEFNLSYITIVDCGRDIIVSNTDELTICYNKNTGKFSSDFVDLTPHFKNCFISFIEYINKYKVPIKSVLIIPSEESLSDNLFSRVNSCYIGWCACNVGNPLEDYWFGGDVPNEYLMGILI